MERVCVWLNKQLQPLVHHVPGHIKDSKELLKAFSNFTWKPHYTWVSCDVTALYTAIPHSMAITALSLHLDKFSNFTTIYSFGYYFFTFSQQLFFSEFFLFTTTRLPNGGVFFALIDQPVHELLGGGLSLCSQ